MALLQVYSINLHKSFLILEPIYTFKKYNWRKNLHAFSAIWNFLKNIELI